MTAVNYIPFDLNIAIESLSSPNTVTETVQEYKSPYFSQEPDPINTKIKPCLLPSALPYKILKQKKLPVIK